MWLLDSNVDSRPNVFPLVVLRYVPCVHVVLQPARVTVSFSTVRASEQLLLVLAATIAARDVVNYRDSHQAFHVRRGHQGCCESWIHHLMQVLELLKQHFQCSIQTTFC